MSISILAAGIPMEKGFVSFVKLYVKISITQ